MNKLNLTDRKILQVSFFCFKVYRKKEEETRNIIYNVNELNEELVEKVDQVHDFDKNKVHLN